MNRFSDLRLKRWAYGLAFALYAGVAYWLEVVHGFILGDALARVSAVQGVLFSRDPHLAAIGFIFTPLTALAQLPMIALSSWWPALAERGFSAGLMSSAFMAGAVLQVLSMGIDRGLPRSFSVAITVLFALHPMIVFYGANGMSEAPFIFLMTWAVRRLVLWMVDDDVHHLIAAGAVAMALAYLTRYDALVCVAVSSSVVAVTTYLRAQEPPRKRRALLDFIVIGSPGILAFAGWAIASWLITGEAFGQFTSQYGNSAIVKNSGQEGPGPLDGFEFAVTSISLLAPMLIPLAGLAIWQRWRRPKWAMLIPPAAIFGSALAFQSASYISGSTFGFLRFYIVAIPFAATLALLAVPDGEFVEPTRRGRHAPAPSPIPSTRWAGGYLPVAAMMAVCVVVSGWGMTSAKYAVQEYGLESIVDPDPNATSAKRQEEARILRTFSTDRKIAAYIDSLNLPDGSVVLDTVYGFGIVAASRRPKVFVVPSDPDYVRMINDPVNRGAKYLIAVVPTPLWSIDTLNKRHPGLYGDGADIATLDMEIPNDGANQPDWRLYKVNEPVPGR